jgi:predicted metalloprotease
MSESVTPLGITAKQFVDILINQAGMNNEFTEADKEIIASRYVSEEEEASFLSEDIYNIYEIEIVIDEETGNIFKIQECNKNDEEAGSNRNDNTLPEILRILSQQSKNGQETIVPV